jgi:hypothetical protein
VDQLHQPGAPAGLPDIFLANEPRAYREVLASTLHCLHPRLTIVVLEPAELLPRLRQVRPALVVYSDADPVVEAAAPASVLLHPAGAGHSVVVLAGCRTTVADFQLDDLLGLVGCLLPPTRQEADRGGTRAVWLPDNASRSRAVI